MMICAADFEELFPDLFQPEHVHAATGRAKAPSAECIARWEDDGGKHVPSAPRGRTASVSRPAFDYQIARTTSASAIAATAPAVATRAAAKAVLSTVDHITTGRQVTS